MWRRLDPLSLELFSFYWQLVDSNQIMIDTDEYKFGSVIPDRIVVPTLFEGMVTKDE